MYWQVGNQEHAAKLDKAVTNQTSIDCYLQLLTLFVPFFKQPGVSTGCNIALQNKQQMSKDYRMRMSQQYVKRLSKQCVQVQKNHKMVNSATYRIAMQDHTVGDLLRIYLLKHKEVKFAGYRQVHPLDETLEVRVQTVHQDTNKVVKDTLVNLQKMLFDMETTFAQAAQDKCHEVD